ncbi:MAG: hypothetical protein U9R29_04900 [Thermodesulfobacteriota bacterium]|nr:hypothetical protein [Thermodesulfobacteriota bacterium]
MIANARITPMLVLNSEEIKNMEKFFNTARPIISDDHYYIPSFKRLDWDEIRHLIARKRFFLLHAPRQTGKTSALLEMMETL